VEIHHRAFLERAGREHNEWVDVGNDGAGPRGRHWEPWTLERLEAVLARARAGQPGLLVIEGEPGMGKTALLAELISRAGGFQVLRAEGRPEGCPPFALMHQWGIKPPGADGGGPSILAEIQALRDQADARAARDPLLLAVDDLQWADPQSQQTLAGLLRRAADGRLLLVVTTGRGDLRHGRPGYDRPAWSQWTNTPDQLERVSLTGLSLETAAALVAQRWPPVPARMARTLWEHTGGNPRYLLALLRETEPDQIRRARVLPAPAAFARTAADRTARLDGAALTLLRAVAVLDRGWVPLPQAASVAGVQGAAGAAQRLADQELIQLQAGDGPVSVRVGHPLLRAAVYQQTPLPVRRSLHGRAAQLVTDRRAALRHRVAAAEQYDEPLAVALESAAAQAYERGSFRRTAEYLRWSSSLTADPRARERRGLESLFSSVLAYDLDDVHRASAELDRAGDAARRDLVLAALALWELRRRDSIGRLTAALARPGDRDGDGGDSRDGLTWYRLNVLLAFAGLMSGHPTGQVAGHLAAAEATGWSDPGLAALHMLTVGQLTVRQHGPAAAVHALGTLPAQAALVPVPASGQLAWRGSLWARLGRTAEAAADLTEATRRVQAGLISLGAGAFHGLLGLTHWLRGDWEPARVVFGLARQLGGPVPHPVVAAAAPLADIGAGRFADADAIIAQVTAQLADAPWPECAELLLMTRIARAHAGSDADRLGLPALGGPAPAEAGGRPAYSTIALLHVAQAQIWAGDLSQAETSVARLAAAPLPPLWVPAAVHWLRGLIHEAFGDDDRALAELAAADRVAVGELPLYQAHMLTDLGRVAGRLGHPGAADARDRSRQIYQRLGAVPYVDRVAAADAPLPLRAPMTAREREVLTLLLKGLSYAQISRELYITRSTVGYHLGNLYAKTGVTSRHQLTELVRAHPGAFAADGS
jgi:DNA-binding CsgD family transcriptional regulator